MILGSSGSGKTTLAKELGNRTGLPVVHLDQEFWRPGWAETPDSEWAGKVATLTARPRWIIDGNYGGTLPLRMAVADTIIFLDFPRLLCLRRVLGRIFRGYGRVRDELPEGCPERLDWEFLAYVWNWPHNSRPRILAALEKFSGTIHVLRQPAEVTRFLMRYPQRL